MYQSLFEEHNFGINTSIIYHMKDKVIFFPNSIITQQLILVTKPGCDMLHQIFATSKIGS